MPALRTSSRVLAHRSLWRLGLCGAVGATVTIALAALGAWRFQSVSDPAAMQSIRFLVSNPKSPPGPAVQRGTVDLAWFDAPGASFAFSRFVSEPARAVSAGGKAGVRSFPPRDWSARIMMPWGTGDRPWPDRLRSERLEAKAAGFPLRAFWCEIKSERVLAKAGHQWHAEGGLLLGDPFRLAAPSAWPPDYPLIIPLRPIWPELVANITIWGGLFAAVVWGPGMARRTLRRARGRCAACGYHLAGLPAGARCPECGVAPHAPNPIVASRPATVPEGGNR